MRYLLAGILGLALLGLARADDKKTDKAAEPPKSLKDQVTALGQDFDKQMRQLQKQFEAAKSPEEMNKIRDKAIKQLPTEYAKKALALAKDHPKDPAAADALLFVCSNQLLSQTPQAAEAIKILLQDHAGSDQLVNALPPLAQIPDGDLMLRQIMDKATSPAVKTQAGFYLASVLQDKDEATAAHAKEAEKLLEDFLTAAKTTKGIPAEMVEDAKVMANLFTGKSAPAATSKDLDDKAVSLADHKGKVVVLDFWATWCPPCRGMIPHEREMVKKNAGKPFVFVSVSADDEAKKVKDFKDTVPMPWTHWFAGQTARS